MANYTMARNGDCQRIGTHRGAHGTNCFRRADAIRYLQITDRLAYRNFAQSLPYALLECGATNVERQIEPQCRGFDKSHHLGDKLLELRITADQMRTRESILQIARKCIRVVADQNRAHSALARRNKDRT